MKASEDLEILEQLADLIHEQSRDTERAPPVRIGDGDDEESTLESLTTRMQAADYAALVDADEALPWVVAEEHGV